MTSMPIDYRYVYKRERYLERKHNLNESARLPDMEVYSTTNKDGYKHQIERYLSECTSYQDACKLLETLYSNDNFDLLEASTQKVIDFIIPMVESADLSECISYIQSADIGNVNKDRLISEATKYKTIDRIIKNHKKLSERFELDLNGKSDKDKCYKICEMVDTYNLSRFIKFNIALEEISYLGYTNGTRMPDDILVENVSNYFLMIKENTQEDIDSYRKAIKTSKVLNESAGNNVKYLLQEASDNKSNYWKDRLNEWKVDPNKSIDTLVELAQENYSNIDNLDTILKTINEFSTINSIDFDIMSIFTEFGNGIDNKAAENILSIIKENNISDAEDLTNNLKSIWEAEVNDSIYFDSKAKPETFTSDDIDKFKMHNMISDAQSVGEFLDQIEKTSMKESPIKITRVIKAEINLDESNVINNIDSNGYISINLRSYKYNGSSEDTYKLLESTVKCINNILSNSDSTAFYTIYENYFDISLRSNYKVILSENQYDTRSFSNEDKRYICDIEKTVDILESLQNSKLPEIIKVLTEDKDFAASVTHQEAEFLYEVLNPYIDRSTENFMDEFANLCKQEANPQYDKIIEDFKYIEEESFNLYDDHESRINFCAQLLGLNEGVVDNIKNAVNDLKKPFAKKNPEDQQQPQPVKPIRNNKVEDPKDEDDEENDENENPKESSDNKNNNDSGNDDGKSIKSLNDAKLTWQGVKSKFKNASAKEQEMSRDLDMEFNHLLNTFKTTFGTDHREEIITGQINKSISKIIKIGIALAGIGILAHSAIIPIIGAIAMFARSRHMSLKEKNLLIDEIDTELQVLEREISRAEQSGSTKKYRQLLTIQKNLQRKRQEIYYSLGSKGKRIPMQSTTGLRQRE